jgi:hypothetical protein
MAWGGSTSGQFHGAWFGALEESATQGSLRSLMAFWAGGAVAGPASGVQAAYRGMLGFWIGGGGPGPESTAIAPDWIVLARRRGRR